MSVSIDTTGEVWFTWRRRNWEEASQVGAMVAGTGAERFPEGWEQFALRIQRRPHGKGALISIIAGYRKEREDVPDLGMLAAADIYTQLESLLTTPRPDPAPAPTPA